MATLKSIKNKYLDADDGTVLGVTTNTDNISVLSLKLATADSLSKFNLVDGFADDYNDATGVDASGSSDETRNAAGKYYSGSSDLAGSTGFTVTGALQTFTVPAGVTSLDIKCFGGGEGNASGFSTGTLATSASTVYAVVVGERTASAGSNTYNAYGYGGGGRAKGYPSGCGLTGVFTGPSAITFTSTSDQARAIIIAGGSGGRGGQGGSVRGDGGGASGGTGVYSGTPGGGGGTQSAVGSGHGSGDPGSVMRGGSGGTNNEDGGAGGGYYGGGGSSGAPAAGGGSGYVGTQNSLTSGLTYAGASSEKTSDADYPGSEIAKVLFKYNTAQYADMTLKSEAYTAQAAPDNVRIILDEYTSTGSATLNTDIKAYASRDSGTTYTQITLADQGTIETNHRLLSGSVDISGQPSGTAVKYKIETLNQSASKTTRIYGTSMAWA